MLPIIYRGNLIMPRRSSKVTSEEVCEALRRRIADLGALNLRLNANKLSFLIPMYSPFPYKNWQAIGFAYLIDCAEITSTVFPDRVEVHLELSFLRWLCICLLPCTATAVGSCLDPHLPWPGRAFLVTGALCAPLAFTIAGTIFMRTTCQSALQDLCSRRDDE